MTEKSFLWDTRTTGDGTDPYTTEEVMAMFKAFFIDNDTEAGVFQIDNLLAVSLSSGTTPQVLIDTGWAILRGLPYHNDDVRTLNVTKPVVGTTGWRLVLRGSSKPTRTVRLAVKMAADGTATPPAVTQDFTFPATSTTWEISMGYGTVTTAGVLTYTDERRYCRQSAKARQGGSETDWNTFGSTDYLVKRPEIVVGTSHVTIFSGGASGSVISTFPNGGFEHIPVMLVSLVSNLTGPLVQQIEASPTDAATFSITVTLSSTPGADVTVTVMWVAIGEKLT